MQSVGLRNRVVGAVSSDVREFDGRQVVWVDVDAGSRVGALTSDSSGKIEEATHNSVRQVLTIAVGISSEKAREINKMIEEKGPKGISSQTQGDSVRVTGKKRDDLQNVIATLKAADLGIPLQFQNFRD